MEATGTAGVGDIGNTDVAVLPLAASSLSGVHFREALGFKRADAARIGAETRLGAVLAQTRLTEAGLHARWWHRWRRTRRTRRRRR